MTNYKPTMFYNRKKEVMQELLEYWTNDEAEALYEFYALLEQRTGKVTDFHPVQIEVMGEHRSWISATEEEVREMYNIEGDVSEYLKDRNRLWKVNDKFLFISL